MNVRIVVADERQASFYDAVTPKSPLTERGSLHNERGGKRDIDLETDRPGRRFGGTNGVGRGIGGIEGHHHGVTGEKSTVQHELTLFAKEVARKIETDRARNEFDRLVLVAGPKMLGLLRQSLSSPTHSMLAGEISKDILRQGPEVILRAVPIEAFETYRM
ncbi:host attachment protein [Steroidobacter cummioxidans]|uniref:host attachment protein n=1 Tax=Steroidobacter cummioxidans TaxID=1803913 RepID=UPI00137AC992|nr:host attachment protein [Steroidobacter cummioxidans]